MTLQEASQAPVSVVIPCFRCSETIERAVTSVYAQTLPPAEIILVDDCSDDDTLNVLRRIIANAPSKVAVRLISLHQNGGPGNARNMGWDAATQPYIAFLDSDDSWNPLKLETQLQVAADTGAILIGHQVTRTANATSPGAWRLPPYTSVPFHPVSSKAIRFHNPFYTTGIMMKRDIRYRFPPQRFSEDYGLWLNLVFDEHLAIIIDLPLAAAFKPAYGASGLSAHLWPMEQGELANYYRLYRTNKLAPLELFACITFSLAKYLRRLLLTQIRNIHGSLVQ